MIFSDLLITIYNNRRIDFANWKWRTRKNVDKLLEKTVVDDLVCLRA